MSNGNGIVDVGQAVELARQTALLHALLAEARSEILEVGVHDGRGREMILEQFPVAGAKRVLAYRTGNGADTVVPATATPGTLVLPANEGRLGGQIVVSGTGAVILYLCEPPVPAAGKPAIWLAGSGGSWDFRLGNLLWCGNVSAVAAAASTLTVAEI